MFLFHRFNFFTGGIILLAIYFLEHIKITAIFNSLSDNYKRRITIGSVSTVYFFLLDFGQLDLSLGMINDFGLNWK